MTKQETIKMLAILDATYPNFYRDKSEEEMNGVIAIWSEMFKDCDNNLTILAVKELINTSKYVPTIASIKEKMYELTHINEDSSSELWERLLKAIRNGYYGAEEEFKMLPDIVKEFVGSPEQLRSIAEMDSETIHSVVKGQFLRQIENLKERVRQKEMMSSDTRKLLFGEINEERNLLEEIQKSLDEM